MARIGSLVLDERSKELHGRVVTLTAAFDLILVPNTVRQTEKSPVYVAHGVSVTGELVEIGVGFLERSAGGVAYHRLVLDAPSWDLPLSLAMFASKKSGEYDLVWSRPKPVAVAA